VSSFLHEKCRSVLVSSREVPKCPRFFTRSAERIYLPLNALSQPDIEQTRMVWLYRVTQSVVTSYPAIAPHSPGSTICPYCAPWTGIVGYPRRSCHWCVLTCGWRLPHSHVITPIFRSGVLTRAYQFASPIGESGGTVPQPPDTPNDFKTILHHQFTHLSQSSL